MNENSLIYRETRPGGPAEGPDSCGIFQSICTMRPIIIQPYPDFIPLPGPLPTGHALVEFAP